MNTERREEKTPKDQNEAAVEGEEHPVGVHGLDSGQSAEAWNMGG